MYKVIYSRYGARKETDYDFESLGDAIIFTETQEDYGEMYMVAIVDEHNIIRHSHEDTDIGKEYKA